MKLRSGPDPDRTGVVLPLLIAVVACALPACSDITVETIGVASMTLEPSDLLMVEGDSAEVQAVVRGAGGELLDGRTITWTTDDPSIARVQGSGRVSAVGAGSTTVRAGVDGVEAGAEVMVLEGPRLGSSPGELRFQGFARPGVVMWDTVEVSNLGHGTLSGIGVAGVDFEPPTPTGWLSWDLEGTSAPTRIRVAVDLEGVAPGDYSAVLEVTSPRAGNSPLRVPVSVTAVEPPPEIRVSPSSIFLTATAGSTEPASQSVAVTNSGGGILSGLGVEIQHDAGEPTGWLDATFSATTAPTSLVVRASPRGIPPGTYGAAVRVTAPGVETGSARLSIRFEVSGPAGSSAQRSDRSTTGSRGGTSP
jgi:hypothetical protein